MGTSIKTLFAFVFILFGSGSAFAGSGEVNIQPGETLDLSRCLEIAIANDNYVKSRAFTAQAVESKIGEVRAAYLPSVTATGAYTKNGKSYINPADPYYSTQYFNNYMTGALSAGLNQLLFDFGKTIYAIGSAKASFRSADLETAWAIINLTHQVKTAYHSFVLKRKIRDVDQEAVTQYQTLLDIAKAQFAAGSKPKYNVTKAETDLSNSQLNLIRAENDMETAKIALTTLLNFPGDIPPAYDVADSLVLDGYDISLDTILSTAYTTRPDLKSIQAQARGAELTHKVAKADRYPAFNLNANYQGLGSQTPLSNGWNAGVQLNYDLFTGLKKMSTVAEKAHALSATQKLVDSKKQDIYYSAIKAFLNLGTTKQLIDTAQHEVEQGKENLDIADARYSAGIGSPLEVSDAVIIYIQAKISLLNSLYQFKMARADIELAMGLK